MYKKNHTMQADTTPAAWYNVSDTIQRPVVFPPKSWIYKQVNYDQIFRNCKRKSNYKDGIQLSITVSFAVHI